MRTPLLLPVRACCRPGWLLVSSLPAGPRAPSSAPAPPPSKRSRCSAVADSQSAAAGTVWGSAAPEDLRMPGEQLPPASSQLPVQPSARAMPATRHSSLSPVESARAPAKSLRHRRRRRRRCADSYRSLRTGENHPPTRRRPRTHTPRTAARTHHSHPHTAPTHTPRPQPSTHPAAPTACLVVWTSQRCVYGGACRIAQNAPPSLRPVSVAWFYIFARLFFFLFFFLSFFFFCCVYLVSFLYMYGRFSLESGVATLPADPCTLASPSPGAGLSPRPRRPLMHVVDTYTVAEPVD